MKKIVYNTLLFLSLISFIILIHSNCAVPQKNELTDNNIKKSTLNKNSPHPTKYAFPDIFEKSFEDNFSIHQDEKLFSFSNYNIGKLKIVSGKIIACDPIVLHDAKPFIYNFKNGEYPVEIAMFELDGHKGNGFVRIKFSESKVNKWKFALQENQKDQEIGKDKIYGYGVDAGTGLYIDQESAEYLNNIDFDDYWEDIFIEKLYGDFNKANNFLLHEFENYNLATFSTGYGDGFYGVYIGLDKNENICQLLTDFEIIKWWNEK